MVWSPTSREPTSIPERVSSARSSGIDRNASRAATVSATSSHAQTAVLQRHLEVHRPELGGPQLQGDPMGAVGELAQRPHDRGQLLPRIVGLEGLELGVDERLGEGARCFDPGARSGVEGDRWRRSGGIDAQPGGGPAVDERLDRSTGYRASGPRGSGSDDGGQGDLGLVAAVGRRHGCGLGLDRHRVGQRAVSRLGGDRWHGDHIHGQRVGRPRVERCLTGRARCLTSWGRGRWVRRRAGDRTADRPRGKDGGRGRGGVGGRVDRCLTDQLGGPFIALAGLDRCRRLGFLGGRCDRRNTLGDRLVECGLLVLVVIGRLGVFPPGADGVGQQLGERAVGGAAGRDQLTGTGGGDRGGEERDVHVSELRSWR
jgi:hypothetical protein